MKRKPIVGETLFDLNIGNAASKRTPQKLTPVIVTKVGRKFFTCSTPGPYPRETVYHLLNWSQVSEFSPRHRLYETQKDWEDEVEKARIVQLIRETNWGETPLATMQTIAALLTS